MTVRVADTLGAAPAAVWALVGDFARLDRWHPHLASCELGMSDGKPTRTAALADWWVTERLEERDATALRLRYVIVGSSRADIIGSRTTISLADDGANACRVTWTVEGRGDPHALEIYFRERLGHLRQALRAQTHKDKHDHDA